MINVDFSKCRNLLRFSETKEKLNERFISSNVFSIFYWTRKIIANNFTYFVTCRSSYNWLGQDFTVFQSKLEWSLYEHNYIRFYLNNKQKQRKFWLDFNCEQFFRSAGRKFIFAINDSQEIKTKIKIFNFYFSL
jgi:hypothetical protein